MTELLADCGQGVEWGVTRSSCIAEHHWAHSWVTKGTRVTGWPAGIPVMGMGLEVLVRIPDPRSSSGLEVTPRSLLVHSLLFPQGLPPSPGDWASKEAFFIHFPLSLAMPSCASQIHHTAPGLPAIELCYHGSSVGHLAPSSSFRFLRPPENMVPYVGTSPEHGGTVVLPRRPC